MLSDAQKKTGWSRVGAIRRRCKIERLVISGCVPAVRPIAHGSTGFFGAGADDRIAVAEVLCVRNRTDCAVEVRVETALSQRVLPVGLAHDVLAWSRELRSGGWFAVAATQIIQHVGQQKADLAGAFAECHFISIAEFSRTFCRNFRSNRHLRNNGSVVVVFEDAAETLHGCEVVGLTFDRSPVGVVEFRSASQVVTHFVTEYEDHSVFSHARIASQPAVSVDEPAVAVLVSIRVHGVVSPKVIESQGRIMRLNDWRVDVRHFRDRVFELIFVDPGLMVRFVHVPDRNVAIVFRCEMAKILLRWFRV